MTQTILNPPFRHEMDDDFVDNNKTNPNPSIIMSVTEDEDDREWTDFSSSARGRREFRTNTTTPLYSFQQQQQHPHLVQENHPTFQNLSLHCGSHSHSIPPSPKLIESSLPEFDEEAYLINFERMMKDQEMEKLATLSHLRPLLQLVEELIEYHEQHAEEGSPVKKEEYPSRNQDYDDFDGSELLCKEFSIRNLERALEMIEQFEEYELVRTDQQFMMVLKMLCQVENTSFTSDKISWGEFLQYYRVTVLGMQTLENLPPTTAIRNRAKDRTVHMISLFRPTATAMQSPTAASMGGRFTPSSVRSASSFWEEIKTKSKGLSPRHSREEKEQQSRPPKYHHLTLSFLGGALLVALLFGVLSVNVAQNDVQTKIPAKEAFPVIDKENQLHFKPDLFRPDFLKSTIADKSLYSHRMSSAAKIQPSSTISARRASTLVETGESHTVMNKATTADTNASQVKAKNTRTDDDDIGFITNVMGGTSVILYLLVPFFPGGTTLIKCASTGSAAVLVSLIGRSIREWLQHQWQRAVQFFRQGR